MDEIGLAAPKASRRSRTPRLPHQVAWFSLPSATLAIAFGALGARLATQYVDEGCPAGASHGVGSWMMAVAVLLLTPTTLVAAVIGLRRGPSGARVAAVISTALVVAMVGWLYSLAYHWEIQCSAH